MYVDFRSDAQHEDDIRAAHASHLNAPYSEADDDIVFTLRKLDEARNEAQDAKFGFYIRAAFAIEVGIIIAVVVALK